jgi:hypothetical protein
MDQSKSDLSVDGLQSADYVEHQDNEVGEVS